MPIGEPQKNGSFEFQVVSKRHLSLDGLKILFVHSSVVSQSGWWIVWWSEHNERTDRVTAGSQNATLTHSSRNILIGGNIKE
jgi:hypothetical protein